MRIDACLFDLISTRSLDHLIRSRQHVRGNCQADLLRRLEIDDELELLWLLDREIGGLGTFENLVDHHGDAVEWLVVIRSIGHQTTVVDKFFPSVDRRNPAFRR